MASFGLKAVTDFKQKESLAEPLEAHDKKRCEDMAQLFIEIASPRGFPKVGEVKAKLVALLEEANG